MFTDQPIKSEKEDKFGRANFAKQVAQVIATREDKESMVIGLHAPWGEGKTSVLNIIIEELKENENILVVNFNPWRFPDENVLLKNFFRFLAEKFDASLETASEKLGNFANKYAGVLSPISAFGFNAKEIAKGLAETVPEADLENLRERIEKVLRENDKRIVIIMDDIDRLNKEEIQTIFRLVKLSADFPNTAYILSFDIDRVADALAEKYGSKEAGHNFLEKIIQISLPLPPATSESLRTMTYEELDKLLAKYKIELSETEVRIFARDFQKAFDPKLKNPRLVKRYINRLTFLFPILQGEVSNVDLMLIEAIHVFYPKLYELIRENSYLFLGDTSGWELDSEKNRRKKLLKEEIDSFPERERENVKNIIKRLFPKTEGILGNTHYDNSWNSNWAKEKKIASPDYFLRYFNYGIPVKDVSDVELKDFVETLESRAIEENFEKIKGIIFKSDEKLFLRKLDQIVDSLDESIAITLARTISVKGDLFSRQDVGASFFGTEPFSQACILIRDCLKRIKDIERRGIVAIELMKMVCPLDFASNYFRWNRNFKDDGGNIKEVFISESCEEEMLNHLISRIKNEAIEEPLEKRYPQKSSRLYSDWFYKDIESLKKHLKERFKKHPEEAEDFIYSFIKQSFEINGIVKSYGFDFIISAIEKSNPQLVKTENVKFLDYDEIEGKENFLKQFLSIYRRNKQNEQNNL